MLAATGPSGGRCSKLLWLLTAAEAFKGCFSGLTPACAEVGFAGADELRLLGCKGLFERTGCAGCRGGLLRGGKGALPPTGASCNGGNT